ncbi:hypothetical protein EDB82DRAFT_514777 [Fusarium venenatum]|nr:hypothetical protein EDB82DRAFT_514777 [Fusarium venenatum]
MRSIMSLKRKKVDEAEDVPNESGKSDAELSISSLLQQALDTLIRLEPQQKQLELAREREREDLKRECQRLRSENQELQSQIDSSRPENTKPTAPGAPLSGTPIVKAGTAFGFLSCEFEQVAKNALEFDINGITTREIGVLCQVLHAESCRNNLKRFMQAQACVTTTHHHCLRKVGNGSMAASLLAMPTNTTCPWCQYYRVDCVWIVRKMEKWFIGSGTPI